MSDKGVKASPSPVQSGWARWRPEAAAEDGAKAEAKVEITVGEDLETDSPGDAGQYTGSPVQRAV